jgi:hypothetical protein
MATDDLTRDQQEALQRRMEELVTQIQNLDSEHSDMSTVERSHLHTTLTREWMVNYRKLRATRRLP